MKKLTFACLITAALAAPAFAADMRMPVKAPPPAMAAVYNWTGFYIGGHVGWGRGNVDSTAVDGSASFPAGFQFASNEPSGILAGGQIGYNWQMGNMVLGVEVDGAWANINGSAFSNSPVNTNTVTNDREIDWLITAAGRLGFAFNNILLYAKGGWAWIDTDSTGNVRNAGGTLIAVTTSSGTRDGWLAGAGAEFGLTPNFTFKVEYNYIDFGSETITATNTTVPGGVVTSLRRDVDANMHVIKGGFNFRWGGGY